MKSFNTFLSEAEDLTQERQRLNLGVSPGQQSLPGMGKSGQGSGVPKKKSTYNPKYYNADGTLKPNAVQTFIQGRMAREYNRPGVQLTPETKARMDAANATFASAAKGDEAASKQVSQWNKEFQAKHGLKPAETASVPVKPRKAADDAFAKKLGLDTPEGAAAAQDAAKDMAADARSGQTSLSGKPVPKARLQVQVPSVEKSTRTGQGGRPVGSTTSRGGVPQLPNIPKGAARVTYGQGAAPTQSFAAFSQKADAMKPPASRAVQQRVAQAATQQAQAAKPPTIQQQVTAAAKDAMSDMAKQKADKLKRKVTNISKPGLPLAQLLGGINTFRYGQSQGENVPTALTRAAVNSILSGAAAKQVGKTVLKKRAPWAIPAAAATYSAVEPAVNWGWDRIKGIMGGNK